MACLACLPLTVLALQYPSSCKQAGGSSECTQSAALDPFVCKLATDDIIGTGQTPEECFTNWLAAKNAAAPPNTTYGPDPGRSELCSPATLYGAAYKGDPSRSLYYSTCWWASFYNGVYQGNNPISPNAIVSCAPKQTPRGTGPWPYVRLPALCAVLSTPSTKQHACPPENCAGNPIDVGSGYKRLRETDYASPLSDSGLEVERHYSSGGIQGRVMVGRNWRLAFDSQVIQDTSTWVTVVRPRGVWLAFRLVDGQFVPDADIGDRLEALADGNGALAGWRFHVAGTQEVEDYDANGRLLRVTRRGGRARTFGYDGAGRLTSITDGFGRQLAIAYDASNRLSTITDPGGGVIAYAYDALDRLVSVTYPDGAVRGYLYNEPAHTSGANLPFALTGIIDENGARFATYRYDTYGRAVSTEHGGGAGLTTVLYSPVRVTDALGTQRSYSLAYSLGVYRYTGLTQPCTSGCTSATTTVAYDANANVASRKDFNGNRTCYGYDLARNLEIVRGEGLTAASCPANLAAWMPAAGTVQRKISTEWHPAWRLPARVAEPQRITSYVYNGDGGVTCGLDASGEPVPGVLCSKAVQATEDATGALGFAAAPVGSPRTWRYTYNANGQVLTADGPRTDVSDVTTYGYHPNGDLASLTNALGHVTAFGDYDAHGRARQITDPNGLITTLAYDARGRLVSREVGGELTAYAYDGAGNLTRVTLPDGSFLDSTYDAAHRLVEIADSLGNRISYTLDAMGNRIQEEVFDPAGALVQKRSREYNNLNRLAKDIGGVNPATEITQYGYDAQGNLTTITDPLGKLTTNEYDPLNRLKRMIEPAASGSGQGGNTRYAWDGLDRLTQVTDPRALATAYTLDGLGNLTRQASPDTGVTAHTYDAAGNLLTRTDARGVVATFTYDALNRMTQATYAPPGGSGIAPVTLTYSYDEGAYGKGRLTGFADPSGSTAYTWDEKGRLVSQTRTISGVAYTTGYGYEPFGRLDRITYPSGRTVDYTFDAMGRVVQIDTTAGGLTQPVVSGVAYHPFGGVKSFLFGNATTYSRSFDADGRISGYTLGNLTRTVGFDAASRITDFTHNDPAYDQAFGYDNLGRLRGWTSNTTSQSYGYDLTGNRTSLGIGAELYPYTVAPASNRLTQTDGPGGVKTFGHDAAGNTTSAGALAFGYDARGRMLSAATAIGPVSYQVNALGQRVAKQAPEATTVFHYDRAGRIIGESDAQGQTLREYVWLGGTPVAVIEANTAYFIHPDHLDTPRVVANQANTILWRWDSDPFGTTPPDEDPDGDGSRFELNLRFAGQYYDKETNLHYNYFRDYDPSIGRYITSDPIGLKGGLNTYLYANANPLRFTDPSGLAIWICLRKLHGNVPGNHTYLWDDTKNRCCGRAPGADPLADCNEKGPSGDFCTKVPGSDGREGDVMRCCGSRGKRGTYFPFANDCVNTANDCLTQNGLPIPPSPPGGPRTGSCSSCYSKEDPQMPMVP